MSDQPLGEEVEYLIGQIRPGDSSGLSRLLRRAVPFDTSVDQVRRLARALAASIDRRGVDGTIQVLMHARAQIPSAARRDIMDQFGGRCVYCRRLVNKSTRKPVIDHIVPASLGGSDARSNLVLACAPCNSRKRASPGGICALCGRPGWQSVSYAVDHPACRHEVPSRLRMFRGERDLADWLRMQPLRPGFPIWDQNEMLPGAADAFLQAWSEASASDRTPPPTDADWTGDDR